MKHRNKFYSWFLQDLSENFYCSMVDYLYEIEVSSDYDDFSKVAFGFGYI